MYIILVLPKPFFYHIRFNFSETKLLTNTYVVQFIYLCVCVCVYSGLAQVTVGETLPRWVAGGSLGGVGGLTSMNVSAAHNS